ncbi:glutathione S-transferase family protein [Achromobacter xylosoxidans]|jgi:glutathione S-transferase|uniref:glutathione S-transferase family protein n=1 Tax=Achromobacter TaxID=222 RepID=UPI0001F43B77|nr:glutathione S-transferase family protein [Achromobacter xylosoxidans]AHC47846.1 Glutathione S-transferase [Achromobacter xylosoxidans NBRC 15126 = ATCC 27061]EFV84653.1 glutathione S-transferase domain-containing protein [Achromobacter xylosoxidans C54]KOQ24809.1 glutathione S-transferase [Achromobacter xylosoxidans]KOQ26926.1 glutathione S-transferase [Achromobacter xylosoxidans]KOQ28872.1 glutathione S-transferase [Achromobacter xylosoxidans]
MTVAIYGHPFSSFTWKALIAAYEREVDFEFRMIDPDHPEHAARIATLAPTGQFPALVDGVTEVVQSNAVIEYLDLHHGKGAPLVPLDPREALAARMMAQVFDDYVHVPMQRIVGNALRPEDSRDPFGVEQAHGVIARCYAWLEARLQDGPWAACGRFTIADCAAAPALFYGDWVHPMGGRFPALAAYRARLLARPSIARVVDEARPYRGFFPLGAPDRD